MFTDTQIREVFHFYFLDRLLNLSDPGLYILKGGVNLRFFFRSPRYSEDMDIDVVAGSVQTLRKNGYKILNDGAFQRSLRSFDIADIEVNDPAKAKQTETTQRFRFGLITPAGHRLPTKVEFSRRNERSDGEAESALVDTQVARCYRRLSFRCPHYSGGAAVVQKVRALAGRPVTQARDVFDLAILFRGGHSPPAAWSQLFANEEHAKAMECLIGLTWQEYEGQVVEFLELDSRKEYGSKDAWSSLQNLVLSRLETDA
ncbi:MAG: nucleotidyl transferase AbiEii/AbiGii toxin family protein [Gammaproteobacteria bacterium]|nr:nucleotidyl transferase AbiEii/AbiGii toxin family protein [Gammaproteobacteria bacterium]